MNDRELLELAAKAAGIEGEQDHYGVWTIGSHDAGGTFWSPLTDDGDSLRLAVKLNQFDLINLLGLYGDVELYKNDPYAATRRAIVRAAARIGKDMK